MSEVYPYTRATLPPHGALIERVFVEDGVLNDADPTPTCACTIARCIAFYGETFEVSRWRYVPEDRIDAALAWRARWAGACCTVLDPRVTE